MSTRLLPKTLPQTLAAALLLLACQPSATGPSQLNSQQPPARLVARPAPAGELSVKPDASGRPQLSLTVRYPSSPTSGFRTQALNCTGFARYQVSIQGIGMPQPLYPTTAGAPNNTIANAGCTLTTSIPNVPFGENRLALVTAYDGGGNAVSGSALAAVFTVSQNPTTVQLSYRSTPAAQVAQQLLTGSTADPNQRLLLAQLNAPALQTLIDGITGASGTIPANFTYGTAHPSLVDIPALTAALIASQGNIGALNPANPAFLQAGGTVNGSIAGLVANDKVTLQLTDPATGQIVGQSNNNFQFQKVPPGTWNLVITPPAGYTVANPPGPITVTNSGVVNLGQINLVPTRPVVTSLSGGSTATSEVLTINGTDFHPDPAGNTVVIGGVTIPAANITVVSSSQLQVTLPNNLPLGATTVAVSTGTQAAVNTPALTVVPPAPLNPAASNLTTTGFDLSWNAVTNATSYRVYRNNVLVETVTAPGLTSTQAGLTQATSYAMEVSAVVGGVESARRPLAVFTPSNWTSWGVLGSNTENVLAVTAHVTTPSRVFYGSQPGGASQGGIWRCDNGTCVLKAAAVSVGAIQALAIDPSNPQIVYAGSASLGVYKSTDGGENWTASNTGLTNFSVRSLLVDPQRPLHVYAGTTAGGVFYSINGGASWTAVNTNLLSTNIGALSLYQPATGNPVIYAGTSGAGVARATGGDPAQLSWESINNGLPTVGSLVFLSQLDITALEPVPSNPNKQLGAGTGGCFIAFICTPPFGPAGGYLSGIWERTDPATWLQIGHNGINEYDPQAASPNVSTGLANMSVRDLVFDPVTRTRAYAATDAGIFRSDNEGANWTGMSTGLPANLRVNAILGHPLRLYIGTAQGLYQAN